MEKEYRYLVNYLEAIVHTTDKITTGNVAHTTAELKCYTKHSQYYWDKLKQIEAK